VNDDAELLQRIHDGAADEFAELVRRHQSQVRSIVGRYERDPHLCDDLAQDVFLKAWRALASFDGRAPFAHWLSKIAVRTALDHLRRRRHARNEIGFDDLGEGALEWLHAPDGNPEPNAARELLDLAMRSLSPAEQIVITLQEIEGRSVREISEITGSSGVAVRVRALRARQKLRRAIEHLERRNA
jgi:RNA polymerase sigma-70 factor (ECF subfamily)